MRNLFVLEEKSIFRTLLLLMAVWALSLPTVAQEKNDGLSLTCQNEPLPEVLKKVEELSGFKVLFTYNEVQEFKVTANVKDASIKGLLDSILANFTPPLEYRIKGNTITITRSTKQPLRPASRRVLRGIVTDTYGNALPGVNIRTNDNLAVGVTNTDGKFEINLPTGGGVKNVTFTFIGMKTVTVDYKDKPLTIRMQDDAHTVDEVVVTGLFNYKASSFTGSAKTFTKDQLQSVGNQNIIKSLSNLDPSFILEDNNLNGSNPNAFNDITIRGNASFSGLQGEYDGNPNEPLFILDGFETTSQAIFDLDMNRVASVTILKDAAAKAIYGSKASNGVVVVETIAPEPGRLRLTYTGDLDITAPDLTSYDLCNAAEKLQVELNAGRYTGSSPRYQQELREQYNAIRANIARGVDTYWLSQPLRTGVGQQHSLYMEGGDERMRYSANIGYNGIAGVMKGSDRSTISGNIKLSYRYKNLLFNNSFSLTANTADDSPYGTFSDYVSANPYYSPYDENGNLVKTLGTYQPVGYGSSTYTYYNPLYNAHIGTKNFSKYTEYTENFYIEWRTTDYLRFTGRVGYTYQTNKREDFYPGDHTMFTEWTGDNYFKRGQYTITDGESSTLSSDITANYTGQFGKHMLLANAAWSLNSSSSNSHGMTAWGFLNNRVDDISFARQYADNGRPSGSEATTREIGITGAVNYSYDDRYMADLSLRYNGSSVFGSDNRWGTFWSVGAGWNIHNEEFIKRLGFINLMKLRASYGLTGNQNFNPYQAKATYNFYSDVVYDNIVGAYLMAMANDKLKWQQTADLNIGLDLQLFSNFNLVIDVYRSKTKDALLAMTLPTSTGFSSYQENLGNVENKGFDATMNWRFLHTADSWASLNFSVGHNVNKITKINDALRSFNEEQEENQAQNGTTAPIIRYEEGQSMTAIWAVQSLGIDPATGEELFLKKDGKTTTYNWSSDDYIVAGDSNPKYHGNFGLSGEYKGIGLTCSFSYKLGGDYYNQTLVDRIENANIANNVDRRVLTDTWQEAGDIAKFKHIGSTPTTTYPTTRFVEKNNELQFAAFSCYYDFKYQSWLQKIKLERLKVAFYMNDLFRASTVKTERGLDYPYARSFSIQLSATF